MTATKLTSPAKTGIARVLESNRIRVSVLPEEGGRIGSLLSLESGVEFLEQPRHPRKNKKQTPSLNASFQDGPCAGIEECLPSVGGCGAETEGGPAPDHGDFWQLAWQVEESRSDAALQMSATGFSRPLQFSKRIVIDDRSLRVNYSVQNVGEMATSFLYACHPLLAVEEGDVVVLPDEVTSLSLRYSHGQRSASVGATVSWPRHEDKEDHDLSVVLPYRAGVAEMFYTGRLAHGVCGLYRSSSRQGIVLRFNTGVLPYLGVWLCYGAWPEDGKEPLQYAVALEPTIAPFGSLLDAQRAKTAYSLGPKDAIEWTIEFQVSEPNVSLEEFRRFSSSACPPVEERGE